MSLARRESQKNIRSLAAAPREYVNVMRRKLCCRWKWLEVRRKPLRAALRGRRSPIIIKRTPPIPGSRRPRPRRRGPTPRPPPRAGRRPSTRPGLCRPKTPSSRGWVPPLFFCSFVCARGESTSSDRFNWELIMNNWSCVHFCDCSWQGLIFSLSGDDADSAYNSQKLSPHIYYKWWNTMLF